jgi:eukaryotic-like serine/threonine-protein kinase
MQPLLGDISRLTFDPGDELNPRWTPDGKWIIFTSTQNGPRNIYRKLANGKGEVEPLLISEESLHVEDVSPDGRFLIFNYYPDQQEPRSDVGGNQPQWRGDGKELFFLEGSTLMAVEVNTEGASFSAGTPKLLFSVNIEAEQRRNRYIGAKDGQRFLVVLRAPTAIETTIAVQVNWPAALKQ